MDRPNKTDKKYTQLHSHIDGMQKISLQEITSLLVNLEQYVNDLEKYCDELEKKVCTTDNFISNYKIKTKPAYIEYAYLTCDKICQGCINRGFCSKWRMYCDYR